MCKGQVFFCVAIVGVFRADMFERCQRLHLLPKRGKQLVVDRGNRDNGANACALNGSVDKLRLTDAVGRKAGVKIGIRRCYLFCFYGNATVVGLQRTNGNIANTIESLTAEIFFLSTLTTISKTLFGHFCK